MGAPDEPRIRIVLQAIRGKIKDRNGLLFTRFFGAISVVENR